MGNMRDLREALRDIKGSKSLKMTYEEGGAVERFEMNDIEVRLPAMTSPADIQAAIRKAASEKEAG